MHVNPTGRFVTGGPMGDAGLTGRKIIVDSYGGMARHGGGAFTGKDPTKVDRSAAYAARWVAKNVVAAGLADRFEVEIAYGIGIARPISFSVESFGTGRIPDARIQALIERHFDLRPASIIDALDLRRPIYRQTAAYGHFGRPDLDLPWERTDKAQLLAAEAGLPAPDAVPRPPAESSGRAGAAGPLEWRPMYAVILAGGGGTRLWPLSTPERPKPFLPLLDDETLLQRTAARIGPILGPDDTITVVTDRRYRGLVAAQLPDVRILAEPTGRNTAAAVALAVAAVDRPDDEVMVVLPADTTIELEGVYRDVIAAAAAPSDDREAGIAQGRSASRPRS